MKPYFVIAFCLLSSCVSTPLTDLSQPAFSLQQNAGQSLTPTAVEWRSVPVNTLVKGQSLTLDAWVYYSDNSANQAITWGVEDNGVLQVDASGKVTALKAGQGVVYASSTETPSLKKEWQISVSNPIVTFPGKIVYVANGELWMLEGSNQTLVQITSNGSTPAKLWPKMSWDGQKIIYGTDTHEVFTVNASASSTPVNENLGPNTIPPLPLFYNQGEIVFQAQGGAYGANPFTHFKLPNGAVVPVTNVLQNGVDTIGGVDNNGLTFYAHNGELKRVVYNDINTTTTLGNGITPDISRTLYPNRVVYTDAGDLKLRDFAGQALDFPATANITEQMPSISPDQSQIVFVANHEGNQDLYLVNADGTGLVNLTNTPSIDESMPDWGI